MTHPFPACIDSHQRSSTLINALPVPILVPFSSSRPHPFPSGASAWAFSRSRGSAGALLSAASGLEAERGGAGGTLGTFRLGPFGPELGVANAELSEGRFESRGYLIFRVYIGSNPGKKG